MGKRALTFLFYLHSSITNPQSFVLPDTTGSTFVCRGLVNTNEDALQTYSSELCLCSLLQKKKKKKIPFNTQLFKDLVKKKIDVIKGSSFNGSAINEPD